MDIDYRGPLLAVSGLTEVRPTDDYVWDDQATPYPRELVHDEELWTVTSRHTPIHEENGSLEEVEDTPLVFEKQYEDALRALEENGVEPNAFARVAERSEPVDDVPLPGLGSSAEAERTVYRVELYDIDLST